MFFTDLFVLLFAAYGLAILIYQVVSRLSAVRTERSWSPAAIVIVDEAQGWIEWFVRKLSLHRLLQGKDAGDLFIVDQSLTSETYQIVSRLQSTHPFFTYIASSESRGIADVLALLDTTRRSQALVAAMKDERDIHRFLKTWEQLQ